MRYDDRTMAGLLFVFGSAQFFLVMLICEGSLPAYSISANAISDLGVGPTAPLFNASIILLGLLTVGAAYFYHRTHHVRWITIPFLLGGIGPIGVGLFPENLALPHAVFALISFAFGNAAALLVATRLRPPLRYVSLVAGIIGLAALVLFLANQDLGIGFGGMERMIVYPVLLWEVGFGGYLMSTPPTAAPAPAAEKAS